MAFNDETIREQNARPCRAFRPEKEYEIVQSFDGRSKIPVIPTSRQVAWFNLYCQEHHLTGCINEAAKWVPFCYENGHPYMLVVEAEVIINGQVVGRAVAANTLVMGQKEGSDLSDNTVFQSTATKAKSRALANAGFSLNYALPVDDGVIPVHDDDNDLPFITGDETPAEPSAPSAPVAQAEPAPQPKPAAPAAPVMEPPAEPVAAANVTAPVAETPMTKPPAKRGRKPKAKPVEEQQTSEEQQPAEPTMSVEEAKQVLCRVPSGVKLEGDETMGAVLARAPSAIKFWAEGNFAKAAEYPEEVRAAKVLYPLALEALNAKAAEKNKLNAT